MMSNQTLRSSTWRRLKDLLLWVALIGIVMLPRVLNLELFIGPDEKILWGWGNQFALALARANWWETLAGDGYPAVTLMWVNTVGVALKWLWLNLSGAGQAFESVIGLDRPLELYAERRMFLSVFNGLLILAAYPLLRIVWDRAVALVAVVLLALEPLLLAFTRMVRADALLAGFMLLSILASLAFVKTGDRRYNWLAGAMGGLAALSKLSGGITVVVAVAIYGVVAWHRFRHEGWSRASRWLGGAVLGWGVPAGLLFFGLWPAWWVRPIDTFNLLWGSAVYYTIEISTTRAGTYFWGTYQPLSAGPPFYFVLVALRLTPWLLVGGLAALVRRLWCLAWPGHRLADGYGWAMLFYVAAYWAMISLISYKTDRYFLPIIPALAVLTAVELVNAVRWLVHRLSSTVATARVVGGVAAALGLVGVLHVVNYHPLYSTYYDPLLGSPETAQWALPFGQGEGVDTALKYLSTLPGAAESTLVCGTNYPRCQPFFAGELLHQEEFRSKRWFEADYALWHIDEEQAGIFPEGVLAYLRRRPPLYVASYHGVEYTWLYGVPRPAFLTGGSKLEGVATLLGYDTPGESLSSLSPGDQLKLHLYWQNEGQATEQRLWWRIVDDVGYVWSEGIAQPLPEFAAEAGEDGTVVEGEVSLSLPPDMPPGAYTLQAGSADARGDVGRFVLPTLGSALQVDGPSVGGTGPDHVLNETLAPGLVLRGYDLSNTARLPGESTWLVLYWTAVDKAQHDYVISLNLLNQAGQEIAAWSGRPVYNTYPTQQWPPNAQVQDPWLLPLPPDLAPGPYRLRLALGDAAGSDERGQVTLGTIDIVERRVNFDVPPMQFQADYSFGDIATLLGYDLLGDLSADGARVQATLYWKAIRPTDQPHLVNVRLVDASGRILAQHESPPASGAVSTATWQAGEMVTDLHQLDVRISEPVAVNLEVRLLDANGNSVTGQDAVEAWIIPNVEQKVMWRTSTQLN